MLMRVRSAEQNEESAEFLSLFLVTYVEFYEEWSEMRSAYLTAE